VGERFEAVILGFNCQGASKSQIGLAQEDRRPQKGRRTHSLLAQADQPVKDAADSSVKKGMSKWKRRRSTWS
jgi:hypothetical protein